MASATSTQSRMLGRKKVDLQWIADDSARRASFRKRRKGLLKKVSELSTLCDIKACAIVFYPQGLSFYPEVWPSFSETMRILTLFKSMPETEQCKKMINQRDILHQGIEKLREHICNQESENRELETALLLCKALAGQSLHGVSIESLLMLQKKVRVVRERIEMLKDAAATQLTLVTPNPPSEKMKQPLTSNSNPASAFPFKL